ncbi:MAG: peptide chain release factor N(5)-glutamine methyltransferase [Anaerolineae bacterium]|nr:peptide chain release factor N(5)-glutamine methyltransferase [Anaerolineae bacterium]
MSAPLTIGEAIAQSTHTLRPASLTPRRDVETLLAHVLRTGRAHLAAHPERTLSDEQADVFRDYIARRAGEWPIAYLMGTQGFYGMDFYVTPDVLIPRPETEHLVGAALGWAMPRPALHVVDVGAGSGAIAVTLAVHLQPARVTAIDSSPEALRVARRNAGTHGVADRITFVEGDLLDPLTAPADLIAANLPYVPTRCLNRMPGIEPRAALDGGPDGLRCIARLLAQAPALLKAPGLLLLEIGGFGQVEAAGQMTCDAFPNAHIDLLHDYANLPRIIRVELT